MVNTKNTFDLNIEICSTLIRKTILKSFKVGENWSKCKDNYIFDTVIKSLPKLLKSTS